MAQSRASPASLRPPPLASSAAPTACALTPTFPFLSGVGDSRGSTSSVRTRVPGVVHSHRASAPQMDSAWCGHYQSFAMMSLADEEQGSEHRWPIIPELPDPRLPEFIEQRALELTSPTASQLTMFTSSTPVTTGSRATFASSFDPLIFKRLYKSRGSRIIHQAEDFDGKEPSGGKKEEVAASVDDYLAKGGAAYKGGFGPFQWELFKTMAVVYGCLGADQLLPVFLAPVLARDWGLTVLQQQLLSSVWFAGGVAGFLGGGFVADVYGRRPAFMYFSCLRLVCAMLLFISPSYGMILGLRLIGAIGASGAFNASYPLLAEHCPPAARASAKLMLGLCWTGAVVLLACVAFVLRNRPWYYLGWFVVPGSIVTFFTCTSVPESPQWLYAKGYKREAESALECICAANGELIHVELPDREQDLQDKSTGVSTKEVFIDLLSGQQGFRTGCILVSTAMSACAYFGLCFAPASQLSGNFYVAQVFAAAMELPAVLATAPLADTFGRRRAQVGLYLAFMAMLLLLSVPSKVAGVAIKGLAVMAARSFGNALSTLKWVINTENVPTRSRGFGLALAGVAGQAGALVGPLLFACCPQPFVVLAVLCGIAAQCTWALPETAGKSLD
mmetsp:Transcript_28663/g.52185  ORF Transcript_28663/g.52185 Transcript_28663/m.52185 type:complete len:617 (+) Transcript_28663:52-1902(+)